jgi:hypothetical protein
MHMKAYFEARPNRSTTYNIQTRLSPVENCFVVLGHIVAITTDLKVHPKKRKRRKPFPFPKILQA